MERNKTRKEGNTNEEVWGVQKRKEKSQEDMQKCEWRRKKTSTLKDFLLCIPEDEYL